jgi:hypothetical protein
MIMSPEVSRPTRYWIDVWCRTAVLAFALAAAPQVPAQVNHKADDKGDDVREQGRTVKPTSGWEAHPTGTTVLTVPLTGTGIEVGPSRSPSLKPVDETAKPVTTAGGNKGTGPLNTSAASPKTKDRTELP